MTGFTDIERIHIENSLILDAFELLRSAGEKGYESVALFGGFEAGNSFYVKKVIFPKQYGYNLDQGLMYSVDGEELHRINVWLYENRMSLIAQIHSHPGEAYHSEMDDRFPIVDTYGGISIVVPNFAFGIISLKDCMIYRLSLNKTWNELKLTEIETLFQID